MSERFKCEFQKFPYSILPFIFSDAKNGICRVENFAEHLAAGTFPRIELGRLCGMNWYSKLKIYEDDNEIYPVIWSDYINPEVEHKVRVYLKLENDSRNDKNNFEKVGKQVLKFDRPAIGFYTPILEILNLKNGWLKNGALSFEYGIQVKAIIDNNVWIFNFNNKLFNAGAEMVKLNAMRPLYTHKLLLHFHSEKLARLGNHVLYRWENEKWRELFIDLLQLCHGVRLHLTLRKYGEILDDAHSLKMFNIISYCDWYLVETKSWERLKENGKDWIFSAIEYNLRHFLASLVKSMTSLKEHVSEKDVEKMSNESMKMFVAKFLYEKF
ncbi:hypothetical protein CAEBREN_09759 [Caenorhabditis brenneri]|uniref:Uncharacterized protein n=1 Tax=Caenorhabditis brenneri TaxID=135651 RepID=G0NIU2_CAEBE|nr:hypothetical protein CAEBREN_09759 [Caenorhabditis brenneri]